MHNINRSNCSRNDMNEEDSIKWHIRNDRYKGFNVSCLKTGRRVR